MDQAKIERVLRLIKMMTGNVTYKVEDMAKRLDTSPRSIYRYIDTFKEAGFVVNKKNGCYSLGKESPYFKQISQLIHFTDEEAHIVGKLIDAIDDTNVMKQNLRRKLSSVYNCTTIADTIVKGKNASNVNAVIEAIDNRCQVILHDYGSSSKGTVRDRRVEPFGFTTKYVQIWCYDLEDGRNKLFNTSRVGSVELCESKWEHAGEHKQGYIDIFRFSGYDRHRVRLELGLMSRNLLIEEYPLSEKYLTRTGDGKWLLDVEVCSYSGICRFYVGLASDIKITDSPEFEEYVRGYVSANLAL